MKTKLILLLIALLCMGGCINGTLERKTEYPVRITYYHYGDDKLDAGIYFKVNGRYINIHPSPYNNRNLYFSLEELYILRKFINRELIPYYREYVEDERKLYDPNTTNKEIGKIFKKRERRWK